MIRYAMIEKQCIIYTRRFLIIVLFAKQVNKYGNKNIFNILEIILKLDINIIYSKYTCIFLKFLNSCFTPLNFNINEEEFIKISYELSNDENEYSEDGTFV